MYTLYPCPMCPDEGVESPETRVLGCCVLPDVDAGNQIGFVCALNC